MHINPKTLFKKFDHLYIIIHICSNSKTMHNHCFSTCLPRNLHCQLQNMTSYIEPSLTSGSTATPSYFNFIVILFQFQFCMSDTVSHTSPSSLFVFYFNFVSRFLLLISIFYSNNVFFFMWLPCFVSISCISIILNTLF